MCDDNINEIDDDAVRYNNNYPDIFVPQTDASNGEGSKVQLNKCKNCFSVMV